MEIQIQNFTIQKRMQNLNVEVKNIDNIFRALEGENIVIECKIAQNYMGKNQKKKQ